MVSSLKSMFIETVRKIFNFIGPASFLSIIIVGIFIIIAYAVDNNVSFLFSDSTIVFPFASLFIFTAISVYRKIRNGGKVYEGLEPFFDWLPLPLLLFLYENLKIRLHLFTTHNFTEILMKFDLWLFGVPPPVALEKIANPILTDIMACFYASYFFVPITLLFYLYMKGEKSVFFLASTCIILCFYIGFIGYVTVPMMPPRFFIRNKFQEPFLKGMFIHDLMESVYSAHNPAEEWGAFPSLHVGVSTVALIITYRFRNLTPFMKKFLFIFTFICLGLWFSTLYLRHHWFVDIVAGWFVAIIAYYLGLLVSTRWTKIFRIKRPAF